MVRFYNSGVLANGITDAPVHTRIEGFRNIAFSSVALILFALICVLWLVNRQVSFERVRSVQK
jgi:hypothetical protein